MDYYLLFIWGCVEPELVGPFKSTEEREAEAQRYWKEHKDQHGYFSLEVTKGCQVDVGGFTGDLFDE